MQLAEERLKGVNVKIYMMPGNDDLPDVASVIEKSPLVVNPEGKVVELDKGQEMISTGFSNPTPWKTPRELSEEELGNKIEEMASNVKNIENCLFNFHVPPYDSNLDSAPLLDEKLTPITGASGVVMVSVGSTAVRQAIEKYQPLMGLHGHIHESANAIKIGRTVCVNPGSYYQQGILRGYVIHLDNGLKNYYYVEG